MSREQLLLDLIGQVYEAAVQPSQWDVFLRALADATRSTGAGLHWTSKVDLSPIFLVNARLTDEANQDYAEHFVKSCPRFRRACTIGPGTVFTDYDVISEREMDRHELYADFLPRHGLRYFCGIVALNDDWQHCGVNIERSARQGHFDGEELDMVRRLSPHIGRAISMQMHFGTATSVQESLMAVIDRFDLGVILVDAAARPLLMNRAAEATLKDGDGLMSTPQGIVGASATVTAALAQAIGDAVKIRNGEGHEPGFAMPLPRPSGARPLELMVAPLPKSSQWATVTNAAAVLFVSDPERIAEPQLQALRQLYGLTPAEAELAAALVSGRSLNEFAAQTRRQIQTVRKTAKVVLAKTETSRQAELVARLTRGLAGVMPKVSDDT